MFGQGFNSPQLHQRFEPRLKACHKTAGLGTSSLPPYLRHALCLALRFVPLMGTEIVTRLCLDISISRHSLSAIAIPSRTLSAPYDSPQLHHATEVGSSAGFRSFLRGDAVGSAPLLLVARHDTPISWRPPTWALAVRQLPSAPPTLRADARAARYESISPYPIGARYSVLASLVLTAQKVVDCIKKKPVKADFFCLSVIARCRRARRT